MTMEENIKTMVDNARQAQEVYERNFNQEEVDQLVKIATKTIFDNAEMLARLSVDETEMGVYEDKVSKIRSKSKGVYYNLRDKKSMGILHIDETTHMIEIAKPMGVVAGITPMTNPVVTPMSKIAFALKTKNAIIIAPHPKSKKCSSLAVELILDALKPYGVPENLIQCIQEPSIDKTKELMAAADVVVATGGMPMVKSAYSSGKPSYGVGAGNVQVLLDRNIDYDEAAQKVVTGRAFDNGIICTGEQSFIYHEADKEEVFRAFERAHAYIVKDDERQKLVDVIFPEGKMCRECVGRSAMEIAAKAGLAVPEGTKVLVVEAKAYGKEEMIAKEKMFPVMGAFAYKNSFEEAIKIAEANLDYEGSGHSASVHSKNEGNIIMAGSMLKVSRVVVNAISATTAGGNIQNGLAVTNTLGCGSWGNNSISENFTYKHLLNITRIAPLAHNIHVPTDEEIWGN